jgi:DNA-binding Lrp family transcriptional regulator
MEMAYVLVKTSPGHERDVYHRLRHLKGINGGVVEVHPVVGGFSLVVKIKAEKVETLGYIVVDKINHLKDITQTEVLTTARF